MSLRFGTDGIRGVAFEELSLELSFAVGRAAASVFQAKTIVVGRDTRESGPKISAAVAKGIESTGTTVVDVGVLPTPGIAFASATLGVPAAVISASHNPFQDNGIKFFAPGGHKLDAVMEAAIEVGIANSSGFEDSIEREQSKHDGSDLIESYLQHLRAALGDRRLDGLSVLIDCANGAASNVASDLFASFGCDVSVINAEPDGRNINLECGSTHPQSLQGAVVQNGAHVGLALDGDADRVLLVDENGSLVDGDEIMGMLAIDGKSEGWLKDDTLVLTVMSNLGLRLSMESHGIHVHETPVGDKHVLASLNENGWSLGGEQSGHIVVPALASTGDGMLTALLVLDLMKRSGQPLSKLAQQSMTKLPQVLRNTRVQRLAELSDNEEIRRAVSEAEERLGATGRVLLRPSGTEPLVRVMVEAKTEELASATVDELLTVVTDQLGKA